MKFRQVRNEDVKVGATYHVEEFVVHMVGPLYEDGHGDQYERPAFGTRQKKGWWVVMGPRGTMHVRTRDLLVPITGDGKESGDAPAAFTRVQQVALWDAINRYAVACGGDPSKHVVGNTPRTDAVVEIEGLVRAIIGDAPAPALCRRQRVAVAGLRVHARRILADGAVSEFEAQARAVRLAHAVLEAFPPDESETAS